ncbi:MAG: hypothetical protein U0S36_15215 [Candidatus Nanopelagicales bacterium]|jgi:hypothetical protein
METTSRTRARAAAVVALTVALSTVASPAFAYVRDDGDEPGEIMSWGTAILLFVGIPLAFAALVWLLVSAPGWTRAGRAGDADAWTGDPLVLDASAPTPEAVEAPGEEAPAITGGSDAGEGSGGTSARW